MLTPSGTGAPSNFGLADILLVETSDTSIDQKLHKLLTVLLDINLFQTLAFLTNTIAFHGTGVAYQHGDAYSYGHGPFMNYVLIVEIYLINLSCFLKGIR